VRANSDAQGSEADLHVRADVAYRATVGYGDVYDCRVVELLDGALADPAITLTVMAADVRLSQLLASAGNAAVELTFVRRSSDEPYAMAPITGFVDITRVSWELTSARSPDPGASAWMRSA
jgi:hypothetical protein